jgi:hypothetical protein
MQKYKSEVEEVRIMKKIVSMILCLVIAFSLVGCGDKEQDKRDNTEHLISSETIESEISQNGNDTEEADNAGDEVRVISDEEIEEAKQAALDYYADTVFEVNAMNYIEAGGSPFTEGDCNFSVNVSKDGVVQETDRIISLKKNGDVWEIVGEGY